LEEFFMPTKSVFVIPALLAGLFMTTPLEAHQIDGRWCNKGRQVTIESPIIITPSGKKIFGEFNRHEFKYEIPAGDSHAGETGHFAAQHDTLAHFTRSGSSQFEEWEPCPSPMS
jgi:hypothetical protein